MLHEFFSWQLIFRLWQNSCEPLPLFTWTPTAKVKMQNHAMAVRRAGRNPSVRGVHCPICDNLNNYSTKRVPEHVLPVHRDARGSPSHCLCVCACVRSRAAQSLLVPFTPSLTKQRNAHSTLPLLQYCNSEFNLESNSVSQSLAVARGTAVSLSLVLWYFQCQSWNTNDS